MTPLARSLRPACWALLTLLSLVAGCTDAGSGEGGEGVAPVHTGQRYRFAQRAAPDTEQVLEVSRVTPVGIDYSVQTLTDGESEVDPLELSFPLEPAPALPDGEDGEVRLGGRTFPCRVSSEGELTTWYARAGDRRAFPGVLKVVRGGEVQYELVAVEEP